MTARILGVAAVLALVFAGTAATAAGLTEEQEASLYEAAKEEGEVTWYVGYYSGEVAAQIAEVFSQKYPGVQVNVNRTTTQVAFQRLMQDLRAGMHVCDVLTTNDPGHYEYLKDEDLLLHYEPENADTVIEAFQGMDPDGYYHAVGAGLVLIAYNSDHVRAEEAPKSWSDLLDPKWKDKIALGHPAYSGYAATWVVQLRKMYGWEYFEELAQNNPLIGRSIINAVTMLNAGERVVATAPSATSQRSIGKGNPIGLVYPSDGAVLILSPSGILQNAPHPNAAKLFTEFLLSEENSRLQVETGGETMHPGVPPAPGLKSVADVKTIRPSLEEIVEGIPEVKEKWRDTFVN